MRFATLLVTWICACLTTLFAPMLAEWIGTYGHTLEFCVYLLHVLSIAAIFVASGTIVERLIHGHQDDSTKFWKRLFVNLRILFVAVLGACVGWVTASKVVPTFVPAPRFFTMGIWQRYEMKVFLWTLLFTGVGTAIGWMAGWFVFRRMRKKGTQLLS